MRCAVFLVVISAVVRPLLWGQGGVGTIVGRVTILREQSEWAPSLRSPNTIQAFPRRQ